ncbi:alkylglycerol monooxygenase isoform X2 [Polyergus mexicanus]|uniref:alkylglycerol monooxygenase isoform X2 n=1 Tax=Polyergus mexicanus TaxID=615972 RepID=UPI0038B4E2A8
MTFEFPQEVPDYHKQIWLPFFSLLILEQLILRKRFCLNDQVTSLSQWILHETVRVFSRGTEYYAYIVIYETFGRGWNLLAWDSPWTWYISFIAVDFCYYWAHRSNHEIHFLWAFHQVHHSSEEFNFAVGLRQSILQNWCNFIIYLPLAFFITPSHFMVHIQFNLIYQLWIHTTLIGNLGPFEWILNTPKHHRVHHGCNLYCLDKNYGGVLIIWDRLFDTFQMEDRKEKIIYGLVINAESFNSFYVQGFYLKDLIKKSISMITWADKLAIVWKGPSWFPGAPRLGLDEFKIKNLDILDAFLWIKLGNNLVALISIGLLFDKRAFIYPGIIELVRCMTYVHFTHEINLNNLIDYLTYYAYGFSLLLIWIPYFIYKIYCLLFKFIFLPFFM